MIDERGRVRVEPGSKRVRVMLGGHYVADSISPLLVWEKPYYPTYFIPVTDVVDGVLTETGQTRRSPSRGDAVVYNVTSGGVTADAGAYRHPDSPIEEIRRAVAFEWKSMDHWFEEDEEVFVHPRDPYKRVDTLASSRRVRVQIGGVVVADSDRPVLLFETGLPTRYYLPMTDVHMDLLSPSDTVTECPYKGNARYWSVGDHTDIAWSYPFPVHESAKIAGLVSFYNEKVDIELDGAPLERPRTLFS
jgi:uncharacterized protein (DUF427 family)